MTPFDDNDLIDRLQSGIAERQRRISAPEGIGDDARRAARRRNAALAVRAGVPVLAAAGAATVLVTSSGSGSTSAGGLSAAGSGGSANPAAATAGGVVKGEETAFIIKRVKAKLAAASLNGTVIHSVSYSSGDVSSNGALVDLGAQTGEGYDYSAPNGTFYQRNVSYNRGGSPTGLTGIGVTYPVVGGKQDVSLTVINSNNHTYSQTETDYSVPANARASSTPDLTSGPAEVQRALQNGQATEIGTTTIDGTQAIALSIKATGVRDPQSIHYTLYVDAQTYQPMRTVTLVSGDPGPYVADWMPATPDNLAKAKNDSIPAGYTKVHQAG